MKTAKLVIGIVSIVLFLFIVFQSCAAGLGNALADNGESSGSAGMLVAFCMLIAGIVGIATRKGVAGGFVSGGFYLIGGIIGIANFGSFADLAVWSVLSFVFCAVYIIGSIMTKKAAPLPATENEKKD